MTDPALSRAQALRLWLWIGCVSFGGPAAQIGLLHREFVERRGWIDETDFRRALGVCMVLPGPEALQLAIYLGWRALGTWGAVAAGLSFVLPAAALLLGLSFVYALYGSVPLIAAVVFGLEATVVALVLQATLRLARRALDGVVAWAIALSAFALLTFTALPYPAVLLVSALVGLIALKPAGPVPAAGEPAPARAGAGRGGALRTVSVGLGLWAAPVVALLSGGVRGLPLDLYLFLTRTSLVTFGGAYAILKYVTQDFVHEHGWMSAEQAVAGLALSETTPGPLLIVLQFFGFSAGWNDGSVAGPALTGALCAALACYATFLPSFILVLLAAPHVARLAAQPRLGRALHGVTAFVVGVIASLAVTVADTVLLESPTHALDRGALAIALLAALLLSRPSIGLHWVLLVGALAGVVVRLVIG